MMAAPSVDTLQRRDVWSRYWAALPSSAGLGSFDGGYSGTVIERWWLSQLRRLGAATRWLELCAGNGWLSRLWLNELGGGVEQQRHLDAIDWASGIPDWVQSAAPGRIRWHAGIDALALPFGNHSHDVVVSQFGIEYLDAAPLCEELARVLRPGGTLAAVLHHSASLTCKLAAQELEFVEATQRPQGPWAAALALARSAAVWRAAGAQQRQHAQAQGQAARASFDGAMAELLRHAPPDVPELVPEFLARAARLIELAQHHGLEAAQQFGGHCEQQWADSAFRLKELRACALSPAGVQELKTCLQTHGLRARVEELLEGESLLGWGLVAAGAAP